MVTRVFVLERAGADGEGACSERENADGRIGERRRMQGAGGGSGWRDRRDEEEGGSRGMNRREEADGGSGGMDHREGCVDMVIVIIA